MTNNPQIDALEPCHVCDGKEYIPAPYGLEQKCPECSVVLTKTEYAAIQSLPNVNKINVQELCDIVLKAAGSGFQHYMPSSKDRIIRDATNYLNGVLNDKSE